MTDALSGKDVVHRTFIYVDGVCKESRKALTLKLNQGYKGAKFSDMAGLIQQNVLDWFVHRDENMKLNHEATDDQRLGEVNLLFRGETKRVRFKVRVHAGFTLAGQSRDSPCFLRDVNVSVDPREFSL